MHDKSQIRLGLGRKHARRGKTRIVDEERIRIPLPFYGVRGIGNDGLKRFIIPVQRVCQRIAVPDVEFIVTDIVQEHIDAAQVVGGDVDLLPVKTLAHVFLAQYFGEIEQQGARSASGVVHLVDFGFAHKRQAGEQLGNFLRGVVFAAALARVGGVHAHQKLVRIAERVNRVVLVVAQLHLSNAVHQLDEHFIPLGYGGA